MITDVLAFHSIADMTKRVTMSGSEFFSPGAMAFFNTRLIDLVAGQFLITADSMDEDSPETYKVRWFTKGKRPRLTGHHLETREPFAHEWQARAAIAALLELGSRHASVPIADVLEAYQDTTGASDA